MRRHIDSFIEYMTVIREASDNTLSAYRRDLERFAADMGERGISDPQDVTEETLADYCFGLEKAGLSPATLARNISSLRAFFRFLVENDDIQRNITDILEQPRIRRSRPRVLEMGEIDRLLAAPDTEKPMGMRDRAILELLYSSGIKVGELILLYPQDIDLRSSVVSVSAEEESKRRQIPFGEKTRDAVLEWIVKGRERYVPALKNAPVFVNVRGTGLTRQSVWKIVKRYAGEVGIKGDIAPGTLRHSFAAHLMDNGADAGSLSRMLGYSTQAQALYYESDEGTRLREVYTRAQRRG